MLLYSHYYSCQLFHRKKYILELNISKNGNRIWFIPDFYAKKWIYIEIFLLSEKQTKATLLDSLIEFVHYLHHVLKCLDKDITR